MSNEQHPALATAPKNLEEAIQRALAHVESDNTTRCQYQDSTGCLCVIGQFFTPEQRQDILDRRMNRDNVMTLGLRVGDDNIKAMTGMSLKQAQALQFLYDDDGLATRLKALLKNLLRERTATIRGVLFDLDAPPK